VTVIQLFPFWTLVVLLILLSPLVLLVQRVILVLPVLTAPKVLKVLKVSLVPLVLLVLPDLVPMALRLTSLMSHPSMVLIGENIALTLWTLKPNTTFSPDLSVPGVFLAPKWQVS
jgi:hypothetical protein